jgi:phage terminase small subunit
MALLENRRHELFAQAIFQGSSNIQAYEDAGFSRNDTNACKLRQNAKVIARIDELSARTVASVNLTKEWVIEQLIGVVIDARSGERKDSAGANKALNLLGLELGMFVERKEVGKPGEFDGLTIADKRARIMGIAHELGLDRMRLPAPDVLVVDVSHD